MWNGSKLSSVGSDSCINFGEKERDDYSKSGKTLFMLLLALYLLCQAVAIVVTVLILKIAKTKTKKQLVCMYVSANLTLFGKFHAS